MARGESTIMKEPAPKRVAPRDPMNDDDWDTAEEQVDALKDLVADLRAAQPKTRKKQVKK